MDPRLGSDTSGPGEAIFAIRFMENLNEKLKIQNPKKIRDPENLYQDLFGGRIRNELCVDRPCANSPLLHVAP